MDRSEFSGVEKLAGKKIVILGCGAQGLNQGLNLRDSGLDVSYALRQSAIDEKRQSYVNATENGFAVGTFEELVPQADLVGNLTPDKQHSGVVDRLMPLMKKDSTLLYSHGFNIVEEGKQIRDDITVIMVAPKSPGSEVREEYKRGFGVPTLIAVHPENDPHGDGLEIAKAYAVGTGGHRAGVLVQGPGNLDPVDGLDHGEQFRRLPCLVALQVADEVPADCRIQYRDLGAGLLEKVFPEHDLAAPVGFHHRLRPHLFGDRQQLDFFGIPAALPGGLGNPPADVPQIVADHAPGSPGGRPNRASALRLVRRATSSREIRRSSAIFMAV